MPDADVQFLTLGIQYYTAGRSAVLAQLVPVAGNLFHHGIELLLKARLSQKRSLKELSQKPFGHCLAPLWDAFKAEFPTENLDDFDQAIALIEDFEELRYPDSVIKHGAAIMFQWASPVAPPITGMAAGSTPRYDLVVNDIDRMVARILQVSSRNPVFFIGGKNEYARIAISHCNPVADFLFTGKP